MPLNEKIKCIICNTEQIPTWIYNIDDVIYSICDDCYESHSKSELLDALMEAI